MQADTICSPTTSALLLDRRPAATTLVHNRHGHLIERHRTINAPWSPHCDDSRRPELLYNPSHYDAITRTADAARQLCASVEQAEQQEDRARIRPLVARPAVREPLIRSGAITDRFYTGCQWHLDRERRDDERRQAARLRLQPEEDVRATRKSRYLRALVEYYEKWSAHIYGKNVDEDDAGSNSKSDSEQGLLVQRLQHDFGVRGKSFEKRWRAKKESSEK